MSEKLLNNIAVIILWNHKRLLLLESLLNSQQNNYNITRHT